MKKIKLFMAVVSVTSLLGITSFAAVITTPKGVQKLDSADIVDALNNNADILDDHIDNVAGTDTLGHIKIGNGLEMTGDSSDVANVKIGTGLQMTDGAVSAKIANDLTTDDPDAALSAAMGVEINNNIDLLIKSLIKRQTFSKEITVPALNFNTVDAIPITTPEGYIPLYATVRNDRGDNVITVLEELSTTNITFSLNSRDSETFNAYADVVYIRNGYLQ